MCTCINAYMYTSSNPGKNDAQYAELTKLVKKYRAGGPVLIGGDFNAEPPSNRNEEVRGVTEQYGRMDTQKLAMWIKSKPRKTHTK